jgi:sugar/nucleoside kinase (ribokinase family)
MPNNPKHSSSKLSTSLDYFVVGHVTADIMDDGVRLGGTAAFSGLTAKALGLKSGMLTSYADNLDTTPIKTLSVKNKISEETTTFKNISDGIERTQYLYHVAKQLTRTDLPNFDHPPAILHLGPVANEVDPEILNCFPNSLRCLTPQGWFRKTNQNNQVEIQRWKDCNKHLSKAHVAVISQDDVQRDEERIASMASSISVFVVTESYKGARVYWNNDARFINAPEVKYADDTGAGDIFASAFFHRYSYTKDPWEAGRFAVLLASWSVTRDYLNSIPTPEEINQAKSELSHH